ncbi:MAG: dihydrofolate reductase [Bacteroidia bacterium]|nr:dihydrofolate reductase [Bacteroidia bacterium]
MISIIVAVSDDWGIGKDNELLWHIPEDMKRFKRLTSGNTVIMGKNTWESLPGRPLAGRKNIVLTDDPNECIDCSITAYSIEDALNKCEKKDEIFVIGGGSVYRQFMPVADRLLITHVHKKAPADVFFPEIDLSIWKVVEKEEFRASENNSIPYTYIIYERRDKIR